MRTTSQWT